MRHRGPRRQLQSQATPSPSGARTTHAALPLWNYTVWPTSHNKVGGGPNHDVRVLECPHRVPVRPAGLELYVA